MNKKKMLYTVFLVLLALAAGLLIITNIQSPPRETVNRFLISLSANDDSYTGYIEPHLNNHAFIKLYQQENARKFKILDSKEASDGSIRIKAAAEFDVGRVWLFFDVNKKNNQWYITRLPELNIYEYGIPVEKQRTDNESVNWTIDIGGASTLVAVHPDAQNVLQEGTPVAFCTLDGFLAKVKPLSPVALTRVLSLTNSMLEDMNLGYFHIKGAFPVYEKNDDKLVYRGSLYLPSATENVTLYRSDNGMGLLAVCESPKRFPGDKIRVALSDSNHAAITHDSIKITCKDAFTVSSPLSSKSLKFRSGDIAEFKPLDNKSAVYHHGQQVAASMFRWYIKPEGSEPLKVIGITRGHTAGGNGTTYNGILEVALYDGELLLINELKLEDYLKAVVPSEMPVQFGLEALKVQAIAARAYAVRAMQSSRYRAYGAHLNDTTASQVYNNTVENEVASFAVVETAGLVPVYNDQIADTRFFSTSCGYTANFHEVWSSDSGEFPSEQIPYLIAKPQYPGNAPSLYNEENIRSFINNMELPGYDRFSPFFRWETVFAIDQLEAALQANLSIIHKEQPLFVLTRTGNSYRSMDIPDEVGRLQNIEVLKRGTGGNIMEIEITTTHGTFKILKEYNIRRLLKPVNYLRNGKPIELKCHDGSTRNDFPLLPSAFAYIDINRDNEGNITFVRIKGGGYGHGVGMSQYGAYGLTLLGKNFVEIIGHYYPGSRLVNIYD